jgi:hypothetical protein
VYHFRGILEQDFKTEDEAKAWIDAQMIPSEYYREEIKKKPPPKKKTKT